MLVLLGQHLRAQRQEARRGDAPIADRFVGGGHQIARDLLAHELIVGFVPVQGVDHPVPIAPGVGEGFVLVQPVRVGVAGHVEPVASPPLAVAGRGE